MKDDRLYVRIRKDLKDLAREMANENKGISISSIIECALIEYLANYHLTKQGIYGVNVRTSKGKSNVD